MATAALPESAIPPPASAKGGMLLRIAMGMALLLVAGAGGRFYFFHMRRPAASAAASRPPTPQALRSLALEPFVVNLASPDRSASESYLRVVIVLRVADTAQQNVKGAKEGKGEKPKEGKTGEDPALAAETAELRDTALGVLTNQQPDTLLTTQGKADLKRQLLSAFAARNPDTKVKEILFTEFLVQS